MKSTSKIIIYFFVFMSIFSMHSCTENINKKVRNWHFTFKQNSKEPYGTQLAFDHLKHMFPDASIKNKSSISKDFDFNKSSKIHFYIGYSFFLSTDEFVSMKNKISQGEIVFISSYYLDEKIEKFLGISSQGDMSPYFLPLEKSSQLYADDVDFFKQEINLKNDTSNIKYQYYGDTLSNYFNISTDDDSRILGSNQFIKANFMEKNHGHGKIYFHNAPICFTNHFLVQNNNIEYYNRMLSLLPNTVEKVNWYNFSLRNQDQSEPSKLRLIWSNPLLRFAFILTIIGLLIYVFINAKRKQSMIPVIEPNINESIEFAKTIGLLYYNKSNHADLCQKMAKYFLDSIREKYNLDTKVLDKNFEEKFRVKIDCTADEATELVYYTKLAMQGLLKTEKDLNKYYLLTKKYSTWKI